MGQLGSCCFHPRRLVHARINAGEGYSRTGVHKWRDRQPVRRIDRIQRGTSEPPSVALLRHILNPTVIVATLLLTVVAYGSPLSQHYLALAALAFLISAQVVSDPVLDSSGNRGLSMLLNHRIFTEWLLVSAALLLLAFALKVTEAVLA